MRAHDHALTHHWRVPDRLHDLPGLSYHGKTDQRRARASVLACAVIAHGTDHHAVSYSRRQAWYVNRFDGVPMTHRTVVGAVDEAVAANYLGGVKAKPGDHLTTQRQSTFWATPLLMDALGGVRMTYERGSAIRLRDADGEPLAFRETERVARMRRDMDGIREALGGVDVGISAEADPEDWDIGQHRIRARRVKDGHETWATVVPTPGNDVCRIFGRGRFDKGGRLYGWWQSLPKARRNELIINGEFTVEPDFEFLHPTLLYAMRGGVLVGDPYETGLFPRAHGKLALNVALNARSLPLAVNAMMHKEREAPGSWPHSRRYTERLVQAVVARNAPIAADIGADRGIDCMAIDSGMAVKVLKACAKAAIPCLPVHDSFRVRARDEAKVTGIMAEVLDATRVVISPAKATTSSISFPHMQPSSSVPLPAKPVVAPYVEPVGVSAAVVETVSPEARVVPFRPVLRAAPPRPAASHPFVAAPVPEALSVSPPAPVTPPCPVAPSVPVVSGDARVPVPAFLLALAVVELEPVPEPSPPASVLPSTVASGSGLRGLRTSLPPADVAPAPSSAPVPASPAPAAPPPVPEPVHTPPEPAAAPVPAPAPPGPSTRAGRLAALAGIVAAGRASRPASEVAAFDARMAELKAMSTRWRGAA